MQIRLSFFSFPRKNPKLLMITFYGFGVLDNKPASVVQFVTYIPSFPGRCLSLLVQSDVSCCDFDRAIGGRQKYVYISWITGYRARSLVT